MSADTPANIAALLGSRICHDLISPIGAIGNGVELLQMTRTPLGPELSLISDSVENANSRIGFFRIAFGAARKGQQIARGEVVTTLSKYTQGSRIRIDWIAQGNPPRVVAKLAFLLIQCLETAMPFGGKITVDVSYGKWTVSGEAKKMKIDSDLWGLLMNKPQARELSPAEVQFALVPPVLSSEGRLLSVSLGEREIALNF